MLKKGSLIVMKREKIFINKKCACGCGEVIGEWKERKDRKQPIYKPTHHFRTGRKLKKVNNNGYVMVFKPEHFNSYKTGYCLEHRYVMEMHLGRKLKKEEDVHHINKIKTDNRLENLRIVNHYEHSLMHVAERKKELSKEDILEVVKKTNSKKEVYEMLNVSFSTLDKRLKEQDLEKWFIEKQIEFRHKNVNVDDFINKDFLSGFEYIKDVSVFLNRDRNTIAKKLKNKGLYNWFIDKNRYQQALKDKGVKG
jgi:HNH endonuclease